MRKIALLLAIVLVVSTPLTVSATPRMLTINPSLGFDGSTSVCQVTVVGNNISEYIQVTMMLKQGSKTLRTWYGEGSGYVYMCEYTRVLIGYTYELVVAVSVDGVACTPVSINGNS